MSTDDTTPQPINPIASLSSLPLEIKTLIVRFASLQDQSFRARGVTAGKLVSELAARSLKGSKWKGSSLNALFLLDTCFSSLCSLHLFDVSALT